MRIFLFTLSLLIAGSSMAAGTCSQIYPSYWQDPNPDFIEQWGGQQISNVPATNWDGPVFQLSDDFPLSPIDDAASQPWRAASFDPLFEPSTDQATKARLAEEYSWLVMRYIQEGNIGSENVENDWSLCDNDVREWYHMPFQTYDVLSGREFVHGLTREAPVSFSLQHPSGIEAANILASTMWAVGFYNSTAAATLGEVWQTDRTVLVPTENVDFAEGAVIGKLLFNTLSADQFPVLENMPEWTANISAESFCNCYPGPDSPKCSMKQESQQCPRFVKTDAVRLLQFDIAVKDSRARGTSWVFGTFVADGQRKARESQPWNRISPLGLMWGNDTPPEGEYARNYPPNSRESGFMEEVVFWDVVDMLNDVGGSDIAMRPGHLGCNSRLNGPADNTNASCLSCHATASVPDGKDRIPPLVAQFQRGVTQQCVLPSAENSIWGLDSSGNVAMESNGVSFADIDQLMFFNTPAATPFSADVETPTGTINVLDPEPEYANSDRSSWISTDYSLQLSMALAQWKEFQENKQEPVPIYDTEQPSR